MSWSRLRQNYRRIATVATHEHTMNDNEGTILQRCREDAGPTAAPYLNDGGGRGSGTAGGSTVGG